MKDHDAIPGVSAVAEESDITSKADIPELPQIRAENFSCPIFVFKPKISLEKAKSLFTEKYVASEKRLPDGTSIQSVVNTASFIYVPSWLIAGSAFGEWQAIGRNVESHQINCERCGGKGTIGDEENKQICPICHGTGKIDQHKNRDYAEQGTAKAVVEEHVQSAFGGIEFNLDFSTGDKPTKVSSDTVTDLYCLQPEHDHKKAKEILTERLALALKNKALSDLAHYDTAEDLHFGSTEVYLFNKVELWLHPFYVCWYEKRGKKQFAVCDAINGQVNLPKPQNKWDIFRNLLILLFVGLVIYLGMGLLSEKRALKQDTISDASSPVIKPDTSMFGNDAFKPLPPLDEPVYEEDQHQTVKPARKRPLVTNTRPVVETGNVSIPHNLPNQYNQYSQYNQYNPLSQSSVPSKPTKKTRPANIVYPSFECNAATLTAERLICSSNELATADRNLAEAFERKKKSTFFEIFRKQMEFEQEDWIENVRNICTDEACLSEAYRKRMGVLAPPEQPHKTGICPIPGHCQANDR